MSIKILHNFYAENTSNDFSLIPTPSTIRLIKKMGLLLKNEKGEIIVLYDHSKIDTLNYLLKNIEGKVKFSFFLFCNNPYFINFTKIQYETDKVFYFSNNSNDKKNNNSFALLHKGEFANTNDFAKISSVKRKIEDFKDQKEYIIKNSFNNILWDGNLNSPSMRVSGEIIEGKYTVFKNEKEVDSFIEIGETNKRNPLGLIDINFNEKGEISDLIETEGDLETLKYVIQFEAQSTIWKYFFITNYGKRLKGIYIETFDKKIAFTETKEVELPNGTKALMCKSNDPLKLSENSQYKFQLKRKGKITEGNQSETEEKEINESTEAEVEKGKDKKIIIKRLPVAGIEIIKPEKKGSELVNYSDIVVYI